ncbi:MAG: hypothetical protein HQL51_10615 [Magnetococcales bacterium]|nr:hypothetical protein [Magnetococcales bacterium]
MAINIKITAGHRPVESTQQGDCSGVETIDDINNMFSYTDEAPGGLGDNTNVSCGQSNGYNELKDTVYKKYLLPHIKSRKITEDKAIKAMCETCREMQLRFGNDKPRDAFKALLSKNLGGIPIP